MQSKKRNALGVVAMMLACAACCALPIFLAGGIAGVVGGFAAVLANLNGWLAGAGAALVSVGLGAWWFARRNMRK